MGRALSPVLKQAPLDDGPQYRSDARRWPGRIRGGEDRERPVPRRVGLFGGQRLPCQPGADHLEPRRKPEPYPGAPAGDRELRNRQGLISPASPWTARTARRTRDLAP